MNLRYASILVVVAMLNAATVEVASGDTIIINGSFEDGPSVPDPPGYTTLTDGDSSIPGWIVKAGLGHDIDYKTTYWENADGLHSIDLNGANGPGGIAQTFSTIPGHIYAVSFSIAGNPTVLANPIKTLEVSASGQSQQFTTDNSGYSRTNMNWERKTWSFTAWSESTELWFRMIFPDYGAEGIGLDAVQVFDTTIPSPSSIAALIGLGAMGIVAFVRRRWRMA
jgi:choice-of-anchor C domain-containing protein